MHAHAGCVAPESLRCKLRSGMLHIDPRIILRSRKINAGQAPIGMGLTDPGAFDTRARIVLTDCSAPSSGAVPCSIQIPGLGLVDLS